MSVDRDIGGPTLAGSLLRAGLVDEVRLFVNPVVLGAATPFFPPLDRSVGLRLLETRTFASGVVRLWYEVSGQVGPRPAGRTGSLRSRG